MTTGRYFNETYISNSTSFSKFNVCVMLTIAKQVFHGRGMNRYFPSHQ